MKKILIATPYNGYVEVTFAQADALMNCNVFDRSGWGGDSAYTKKGNLEIEFVEAEKLTVPDIAEVNIKEVMLENNRLTRLVEQLQSQIKPTTSTELVVD
jgi:hypothetical protein